MDMKALATVTVTGESAGSLSLSVSPSFTLERLDLRCLPRTPLSHATEDEESTSMYNSSFQLDSKIRRQQQEQRGKPSPASSSNASEASSMKGASKGTSGEPGPGSKFKDPRTWFGALPPMQLRASQSSFQEGEWMNG
jgi:hypothetical protein